MSGRGGARPGAGRKKGIPNRATTENKGNLEELARTYTEEALLTIAKVMRNPREPGITRIAAAEKLLNRGYGTPRQAIDVSGQVSGTIEHEHLVNDAQLLTDAIIAAARPGSGVVIPGIVNPQAESRPRETLAFLGPPRTTAA